MKHCYLCQRELTQRNSSKEHIIPNALGGKLTARILCHDCNNKLGSSCDALLAKSLEFFANRVNHSRSHGKVQPFELKLNGHPLKALPGGGFKSNPSIEKIDDKHIRIVAYGDDIESATDKIFSNLLKKEKISQQKYLELKQSIQKQIKVINNPCLEGEVQFNHVWLGLLKIAINYALTQGISRTALDKAINVLVSGNEAKATPIVNFYYSNELFPSIKGAICHMIHLIGDPETKSLYCLISLYGVLQSIVLLSSQYVGKAINTSYVYDVWNEKEVFVQSTRCLTENELNEAFANKSFNHDQQLALERFLDFFVISRKFSTDETIQWTKEYLEEYAMKCALMNDKQIPLSEFKAIFAKDAVENKQFIFQTHLLKDKQFHTWANTVCNYCYELYINDVAKQKFIRLVINYVKKQINERTLIVSNDRFWEEFQYFIHLVLDKSDTQYEEILRLANSQEFRNLILNIWQELLAKFKQNFPGSWERIKKI